MIKNPPAMQETRFNPWVRKIPWRREWKPTPVFWPGKSHGQRSLVGYSPWSHKELDMTEWLIHTHSINIMTYLFQSTHVYMVSNFSRSINIGTKNKTMEWSLYFLHFHLSLGNTLARVLSTYCLLKSVHRFVSLRALEMILCSVWLCNQLVIQWGSLISFVSNYKILGILHFMRWLLSNSW